MFDPINCLNNLRLVRIFEVIRHTHTHTQQQQPPTIVDIASSECFFSDTKSILSLFKQMWCLTDIAKQLERQFVIGDCSPVHNLHVLRNFVYHITSHHIASLQLQFSLHSVDERQQKIFISLKNNIGYQEKAHIRTERTNGIVQKPINK